MIQSGDPTIEPNYHRLKAMIKAHGVEQWTEGKADEPSVDSLIYLCKFAFFTAILTKSQIGEVLKADKTELKKLVKAWYDSHRERGCGTC